MTTSLELQHFAVLSLSYSHTSTSIVITCATNNPCHLTCYFTDKEPLRHATSRVVRGLALPWGAYFCFVAWQTMEQIEPGDTLSHSFGIPDWSYCQTKWLCFRGTVAGAPSPSASALLKHHHPGVIAGIEEQPLYDGVIFVLPTRNRAGQRLIITKRSLTTLAFVLERYGGGWTTDISFTIRRVSDDSIIATKVWGLEASVPTVPTWLEVAFPTPIPINEEARITVDWPDARYSASNNLRFHFKTSDVKPDEIMTWYQDGYWYEPYPWDAAYRYRYYE
ncbi:hypothetical protein ES705_11864 [subsurface metagenome]